MQAYCVKCHDKREMMNARAITMKNGKPAIQGICPVCGTRMFRIGGKARVVPEFMGRRKPKYPEPEQLLYR
jgi:ribosomal protein S27E